MVLKGVLLVEFDDADGAAVVFPFGQDGGGEQGEGGAGEGGVAGETDAVGGHGREEADGHGVRGGEVIAEAAGDNDFLQIRGADAGAFEQGGPSGLDGGFGLE